MQAPDSPVGRIHRRFRFRPRTALAKDQPSPGTPLLLKELTKGFGVVDDGVEKEMKMLNTTWASATVSQSVITEGFPVPQFV